MDSISPSIVTAALAAATIAKILVDLVRMSNRLPGWSAPLLAVLFGILAAVLLQLASGAVVTVQLVAQCVLTGILAASTAVGATELQKQKHQPLLADLLQTPPLGGSVHDAAHER